MTFNDTKLIYQDAIQVFTDNAITQELYQSNKFARHIIALLVQS